ncbi:hypothetical protein V8E53_001542 [Lactarius tabidus]
MSFVRTLSSSPMTNCLRGGSLTFDPLFLETFAKHYFSDGFKAPMPLRGDALLNDKAFNFVKVLLVVRLLLLQDPRHTVEELQSFSNVHTPSPPCIHVVRLVIPTISCDEAAVNPIKVFGGEDVMKRVVGYIQFYLLIGSLFDASHHAFYRSDVEWVSTKKDWQNAQKRDKERRSSDSAAYQPEMNEMRCILYAHGGTPLILR